MVSLVKSAKYKFGMPNKPIVVGVRFNLLLCFKVPYIHSHIVTHNIKFGKEMTCRLPQLKALFAMMRQVFPPKCLYFVRNISREVFGVSRT